MTCLVSSRSERVRIRPQGRTVVIGERCNALGFKKVARAARLGAWGEVVERARAQQAAGAQIINVNMVGVRDESEQELPERDLLPAACLAILQGLDVPLALDFGDPAALEAALRAVKDHCGPQARPLINSNSGESAKRDFVFELARKYQVPMVAMTCDDDGIPASAGGRLKIARELLEQGARFGIPREDFIFDCVCIGVGTDVEARPGPVTMETLQLLRRELGCSCLLGASNASFGLPQRRVLDASYLAIAIFCGMNVALTDPTHEDLRWAILSADAVSGADRGCRDFLRAFRQQGPIAVPALSGSGT